MNDFFRHKDSRIPAKILITTDEQARGLMGDKNPPPATAFVYTESKNNRFWMKATPAPLDIIFCHRGKVAQICFGEPYSTKIIGDDSLSDLVIEMPYGSARKMGMEIGDDIDMEYQPESLSRIVLRSSYAI